LNDSFPDFLSLSHASYISKSQEPTGYFSPPYFAFIPNKLKSFDSYELNWAYSFWHEFWHVRNKQWCYLGSYELILNYIAEDLLLYAASSSLSEKTTLLKNRHLKKALNIVEKLYLLHQVSTVANELSPTYYLLNERTQSIVASSLHEHILSAYFPKKKFTSQHVAEYVQKHGDILLSKLENESAAIERPEHIEAFVLGTSIINKWRDVSYIDSIPLLSMNINISYLDLFEKSFKSLRNLIKSLPLLLNPDYRLKKMVKEGALLVSGNKEKNDALFLSNLLRMATHKNLPTSLRKNRANIKSRLDEVVKSEKAERSSPRRKIRQPILMFPTEAGDLFITEPVYKKTSKLEMVQRMLSTCYASELLLRLSGYFRYRDDLLRAIRFSLCFLKPKVKTPSLIYEHIERLLKNSFDKKIINRIIPE
jgi:hypothetical protein